MEYVYGALLLHKAGQKIDGGSIVKVLEAAGIKADAARANATAAALEGVNIDEAIKQAPVGMVAAPTTTAPAANKQEREGKKEEKKTEEDKAKGEEEAASGLAALFA